MQWISADVNARGERSQDTALNNIEAIGKLQVLHA